MLAKLFKSVPDYIRIRPPLYHPDFPYILMWSQKSGCTTVVKWFFAQVGLLDEALAYARWIHRYEGEVFKRRPNYRKDMAEAIANKTHKVVKVVRDPLRRAPSAFLVLAERGAIGKRHHWVKDHWDLVDDWLSERGEIPKEGLSFMQHLEMVKAYERRAPLSINLHLAPQFVAGEEDAVDTYVPIERFQAWAETTAKEDGLKAVDFDAITDSVHHHKVVPSVTEALGERPETVKIVRGAYADGDFPSSSAFLNPRSLPLVRAAYQCDIERYGHLYGLDKG
ncbi:MAG: hypothetical protein ROR55_09845 [Devosia sp.]